MSWDALVAAAAVVGAATWLLGRKVWRRRAGGGCGSGCGNCGEAKASQQPPIPPSRLVRAR